MSEMADKTSKQDKQRPWQDEMGKGTSLLMVVTTVVKNVKRKVKWFAQSKRGETRWSTRLFAPTNVA